MADSKLQDFTITTTEQTLGVWAIDNPRGKSLFLINQGPGQVTFYIDGSPTGIQAGQFVDQNGANDQYTAAQIALHYVNIGNVIINANDNHFYDLTDYRYNYLRLRAVVTTGTTATINYAMQKAFSEE